MSWRRNSNSPSRVMARWSCAALFTLLSGGVALAQTAPACHRGSPSAPVKIEIYSDFECPACYAFYMQTMRAILSNYADRGKICVVFREYPLDIHPHARLAARYSQAALKLGLPQWNKVADTLFQQQRQWSQTGDVASVLSRALTSSEMAALRRSLQDPTLNDKIDRDILAGMKLGIDSTPTFFITGKGKTEKVAAALTYGAMQRRIEELLPR